MDEGEARTQEQRWLDLEQVVLLEAKGRRHRGKHQYSVSEVPQLSRKHG